MSAAKNSVHPLVRCSYCWEIPWQGHRAVLAHRHCRRKTRHESGQCWQHRPSTPNSPIYVKENAAGQTPAAQEKHHE